MTTGGPDTSDVFEEEVNPANPRQYRYDGRWRDTTIARGHDRRQGGRQGRSRAGRRSPTRTTGRSSPGRTGKAYAMAIPYRTRSGLTDQCYEMMKARNLDGDEAGALAAPVDGAEHHGRHGPGRHLLPAQRPRADPRQRASTRAGRSRATRRPTSGRASTRSPTSCRSRNPPGGWMQNCNCSPAAMMNQDQPARARYADQPYLFNESPVRDIAPACRDDDRPARRRRQGDRRAGHRHRLQHRRSGTPRRGRRGSKEAWTQPATPTRSGDADAGLRADRGLGPPQRRRLRRAPWRTTPSRRPSAGD